MPDPKMTIRRSDITGMVNEAYTGSTEAALDACIAQLKLTCAALDNAVDGTLDRAGDLSYDEAQRARLVFKLTLGTVLGTKAALETLAELYGA